MRISEREMPHSFTTILVPVDCSFNSDHAVQKAIELIEPVHSVIHLFHIAKSPIYVNGYHLCAHFVNPSLPKSTVPSDPATETKLNRLKEMIKQAVPGVEVVSHIVTGGNIQERIIEAANELGVQLIVIAKSKSHKWHPFIHPVDTSLIAKKTHKAVLTVRPGSTPNKIRSVVLPVGSFVPERKIQLLSAVTRKNKPTVHLVTMHNRECNTTSVFVQTYRMISEYMHYPVDYRVLDGSNFPRAIFDYAKHASADMILLNPYTESRINSLYGTDISDVIPPSSKLSILTAMPLQNGL